MIYARNADEKYVSHFAHILRCLRMSEVTLMSGILDGDYTYQDVRALAIHVSIDLGNGPITPKMLEAWREVEAKWKTMQPRRDSQPDPERQGPRPAPLPGPPSPQTPSGSSDTDDLPF